MSDHDPAPKVDAAELRKIRIREAPRGSMRLTLADPPEQGWIAARPRYYGAELDSAFRAKR